MATAPINIPDIHTERLLLRKIYPEDLDHIYRGLSHPEVIRFYGVSYTTREKTQAQMDWYADLEEKGTGIFWAVWVKKSENERAFAGVGGVYDIHPVNRKAEIGFWLLPEFWGMGIMKEATDLILTHCFEVLDLHRIEGYVEAGNEACKSALRKIGFTHEGTMRECEFKDGKFISEEIWALLNDRL